MKVLSLGSALVSTVGVGTLVSVLAVSGAATAIRQAEAQPRVAIERRQAVIDSLSPAGIVQMLVSRHIGGTMGFDTTAVAAKRRWLSASLLARLERYFSKPLKAKDLPAIDFDPFIDAQDYPNTFTVVTPRKAADRVLVPVRFSDGIAHYTVTYVLRVERGAWRITDIRDRRGGSLMRLLR